MPRLGSIPAPLPLSTAPSFLEPASSPKPPVQDRDCFLPLIPRGGQRWTRWQIYGSFCLFSQTGYLALNGEAQREGYHCLHRHAGLNKTYLDLGFRDCVCVSVCVCVCPSVCIISSSRSPCICAASVRLCGNRRDNGSM